eukprot:542673-Prymnesium_polylepis.2
MERRLARRLARRHRPRVAWPALRLCLCSGRPCARVVPLRGGSRDAWRRRGGERQEGQAWRRPWPWRQGQGAVVGAGRARAKHFGATLSGGEILGVWGAGWWDSRNTRIW